MSKRILITLVVISLLVIAAIPASAAITDEQSSELEALYNQQLEIRKQLIERRVDFGLLTEEQGAEMLDRMELMHEQRLENRENGFGTGGYGACGGLGFGSRMRDFGGSGFNPGMRTSRTF